MGEALGFVKIRGNRNQNYRDRRQRMKRRAGSIKDDARAFVIQNDMTVQRSASLASGKSGDGLDIDQRSDASGLSQSSRMTTGTTGTAPATEARPRLAERLMRTVTQMEQQYTKKLDQAGRDLRQAPGEIAARTIESAKSAAKSAAAVGQLSSRSAGDVAARSAAPASAKLKGSRIGSPKVGSPRARV